MCKTHKSKNSGGEMLKTWEWEKIREKLTVSKYIGMTRYNVLSFLVKCVSNSPVEFVLGQRFFKPAGHFMVMDTWNSKS